ncbi:unnamed protein product [Echinostoma caproni]|uniref:BRCT domain-containing protein n=1 Tax=Echinostoma caproni TaxID=27848 RepID=A0A183APR1_9TREM|nr:unnamed protein product [Echinostoma caproni]
MHAIEPHIVFHRLSQRTLHQYMHPDVQFVVTRSAWNEDFDAALVDNANLIFVRPEWIFACDEQAKRVPFQKYLVVG